MHFILIEFAPKLSLSCTCSMNTPVVCVDQLRSDEMRFASPDPAEYELVWAAG